MITQRRLAQSQYDQRLAAEAVTVVPGRADFMVTKDGPLLRPRNSVPTVGLPLACARLQPRTFRTSLSSRSTKKPQTNALTRLAPALHSPVSL